MLGELFESLGDQSSALQQHDRVLSVYERVLPATDPLRISAMGSKAGALDSVGRKEESLALFKAAVKLGLKVLKEDSNELLWLEGGMANALTQSGMREEAVEVYKRRFCGSCFRKSKYPCNQYAGLWSIHPCKLYKAHVLWKNI